ncbi:hypothetical protein [Cryobacterium sp. AP23]
MDSPVLPPDAERELDDLRRRAYGPHPDIQSDPAALARLTELEAAHAGKTLGGGHVTEPADGARPADSARPSAADQADPTDGTDPEEEDSEAATRTLWHRLTGSRIGRGLALAGALAVIIALAFGLARLLVPQPDATLHQLADEADDAVMSVLDFLGTDADLSTVRGFEEYRGVEPWFVVENTGEHCFMIIQRSSRTVDGANCVPPGVEQFADIGEWPLIGPSFTENLPDGSVIRFHYRGDSVDVYVYPTTAGD